MALMLFGRRVMGVCGGQGKCPGALRGVGEGEFCAASLAHPGLLSPAAWEA